MKAQDLRKSILQYAMEGKLVPQDPTDEPASELLKRIKAEKEQLIKDGKIKKEKPLPPITKDEIPYELPQGWEWVRLGEIGDWGAGSTPNKAKYDYYKNGTINWLKTGDLNDGYIKEIPQKITELALKETSVKIKPIGSLLIAMYGATIGKLGILDIPATTNQACCACVAFSGIEIKYLFYYLLAERDNLKKRGAGAAQPNISREKIIAYLFPLPPFAEQKRIIEKLEEILALVDEYGKNEEILSEMNQKLPKQIRQSILQYAVQGKLVEQNPQDEPASELLKRIKAEKEQLIKDGKIRKEKPLPPITKDEIPYELPQGWEWVRLGLVINYGSTGTVDNNNNLDENTWILDLEDIEKESSRLLVKNIIKNKSFNSSKKIFKKGDVLYGKLRPYLDKVIVAEEDGICTTEILPLRIYYGIDSYYLKWFLKSPIFIQYVNQLTYGVKMPRLGTEDGKNALLALPPLAEQKRIVAKVEELMQLVDKLEFN